MSFAYKTVFEVILAKLDAETRLRAKRSVDDWILKERACVRCEVNRLRALQARAPISMADVERAERLALGHSDYVRKYAHAAADLVLRERPWA
jgi:predicted alpha/beta hydrolase